jgi:Pyridoxamine 5'-phosphate oxidase
MQWSELERRQPRLAEIGRQRLLEPGVVLVATVRRDGAARLSPVEPLLLDGELWLCMLWGSTKAADLGRDPRVLVHSIITSRNGGEGEFKVRGRAHPVEDLAIQRRYAATVTARLGWRPVPGRFHLFTVELHEVTFIRYDDATGDQYVVRWPQGREFVRRGTSATSLGDPQPRTDILAAE